MTRHATVTRLFAAAALPMIVLLGWAADAILEPSSARNALSHDKTAFAILCAMAVVAGSLVGRRVLLGKRAAPAKGADLAG